jgi:predicted membrane chloride channel (bestrophin family)
VPRLLFLTVVGALMGLVATWAIADRIDLARTATVVLGAILAVGLGVFANVIARR